MLEIKDLHVKIEDKEILKGVTLTINPGEVHSIMGPNGSGKSTLSQVLAGRESYKVTSGSITFKGKNLLELAPEQRACEGIFMAFQYPVEIPGVANTYLLREALNSRRKYQGLEPLKHVEFIKTVKEKMKNLKIDESMLNRSVNEGFSGGEKKRNEIFQMQVLEPELCILDETDSGLDIDALQVVADGINSMRNSKRSFIIITHYQRLLNYVVPDYVHVLIDGKIEKSGNKELALELEEKGYAGIGEQLQTAS
ncbi:MAG: Fe-S cluster assembly ATPase SufC [Deltaproteobacteria bacterium]|nr:Fe-S cluster assembly ATPase SufC [Candidatus Dadabacteria bacterium]TDJ04424.1 MAG: Fe-S cluster assembly ATPase SufC [Deltaproteobacteria bacterium]